MGHGGAAPRRRRSSYPPGVLELFGSLAIAAVHLALAALVGLSRRRDVLAISYGAFNALLALYKVLEHVSDLGGSALSDRLELSVAALVAIPALIFLASVLGLRRRLRVWLAAMSLAFVGLAVALATDGRGPGLLSRWAEPWAASLALAFAPFVYFLVRGWLRGGEERLQLQLIGSAFVLALGGALSDLLAAESLPVPRLGAVGFSLGSIAIAGIAIRGEYFGKLGLLRVNIWLLSVTSVVALFVVFAWSGERTVALVVGLVATAVSVGLVGRPLFAEWSTHRAQQIYLATMGRLTAQLAHDIRNPLTAVRSSAELLVEERRRGHSLEGKERFLELILEQTLRIEASLALYQRLGRCEPEPEEVDPRPAFARLEANRTWAPLEVDCRAALVRWDPALVEVTLENLVRNAREAAPDESLIRVELASRGDGSVELSVRDRGPGMDAATAAMAADDFFTTKAQGSGLGLAYARRVAEAHGGQLSLDARLGEGTTVRLRFPGAARGPATLEGSGRIGGRLLSGPKEQAGHAEHETHQEGRE